MCRGETGIKNIKRRKEMISNTASPSSQREEKALEKGRQRENKTAPSAAGTL